MGIGIAHTRRLGFMTDGHSVLCEVYVICNVDCFQSSKA